MPRKRIFSIYMRERWTFYKGFRELGCFTRILQDSKFFWIPRNSRDFLGFLWCFLADAAEYLIRINFRADKISRKFAHRHPNVRNFIRELRAEKSCAEINPRENIQTWKFSFPPSKAPIFGSFSRVLIGIWSGCAKINPREIFQNPGCAKICPNENLYE